MGMLFTYGGRAGARARLSGTGDRPSVPHRTWLAGPHPQVVKDVADKGDVADPALQGAGSKLLPSLVLLLQPVEESTAEDTLACLLALCL